MGFRTTKLGERVSVDTRKMSNGESELFEFDGDTKPYFVDYTLTDFIVKMINEKRITTAKIAVRTVARFLHENPDSFDLVEWVLFDTQTESVYEAEVTPYYNIRI